jgi:hypothetical protein
MSIVRGGVSTGVFRLVVRHINGTLRCAGDSITSALIWSEFKAMRSKGITDESGIVLLAIEAHLFNSLTLGGDTVGLGSRFCQPAYY